MRCASCVSLNQNTLQSLKGVSKVAINLATKQATIEFDENKIELSEIQNKIESNGFTVVQEQHIKG
jgi:copper chaperone CopZ